MMIGLPEKIRHLIGEEKYDLDDIGLSDSTVIMFRDTVLKIQSTSEESQYEYQVMQWLQDKLPVPKILGFERVAKAMEGGY